MNNGHSLLRSLLGAGQNDLSGKVVILMERNIVSEMSYDDHNCKVAVLPR